MTNLSSEEVAASHLASMGKDLGELFNALYNEVVYIHLFWQQFKIVFGTSASRIDLLNEAGAGFFGIVQRELWESALLGVARLTDPDRKTLSVQRLPRMVLARRQANVQTLVDTAVKDAGFARDWRHRRIAHRSLDLVLDRSQVRPLQDATRINVDTALKSIAQVMNYVGESYGVGHTSFAHVVPHLPDGENLLYVLRDGLAAYKVRNERLARGEFQAEDLDQPTP